VGRPPIEVEFRERSSGALYEKDEKIDVRLTIEICMGSECPRPADRGFDKQRMELVEMNPTGAHDEDPIVMVQELVDEPEIVLKKITV
jgi:hypothetical protein